MKILNQEPSLDIISNGKVFLYLPKQKYKKRIMIGAINYLKKTYYTTPKSSKKHLFKKGNSLSVPMDLIERNHSGFIYVCVPYDGCKLWTTRLALIKNGYILHFKEQGFEKQLFLELNKWKKTKRRARIERLSIRKELRNEK